MKIEGYVSVMTDEIPKFDDIWKVLLEADLVEDRGAVYWGLKSFLRRMPSASRSNTAMLLYNEHRIDYVWEGEISIYDVMSNPNMPQCDEGYSHHYEGYTVKNKNLYQLAITATCIPITVDKMPNVKDLRKVPYIHNPTKK